MSSFSRGADSYSLHLPVLQAGDGQLRACIQHCPPGVLRRAGATAFPGRPRSGVRKKGKTVLSLRRIVVLSWLQE